MIGLFQDRRIGGLPKLVFCDRQKLMRVPDEIRDCVCFVKALWGHTPTQSTAFFVGVRLGIEQNILEDTVVVYAVTAKHCIMQKGRIADSISLRLNTRSGGSSEIQTDPAGWIVHPAADCAVLPIELDGVRFQYRVYPLVSAATTELVQERNIGPGDDVFLTGLLVHHPGKTRIVPVVRLGSIAAVLEDPINMDTGGSSDVQDVVTLLELHSIGGISGSPVFVHLPFWRDTKKGDLFVGGDTEAGSGGEHYLLGVMHGFYPVGKNDPENVSGGDETLNTGIAAVVRVDRILDLVNDPGQREMRRRAKEQIEADQKLVPTAAVEGSSEFSKFEGLATEIPL